MHRYVAIFNLVRPFGHRMMPWKFHDDISNGSGVIHVGKQTHRHYWENTTLTAHSFIHFWHAPLRVHSAQRRHQSPEWVILSQVNCFIQGEVNWFQVLLDSLHPHGARASWWSPPVLQGEAVKIFYTSVSSGSHAMWPNRERRRAWTMAETGRCSVVRLHHSIHSHTIWFPTVHWSRALIWSASLSLGNCPALAAIEENLCRM